MGIIYEKLRGWYRVEVFGSFPESVLNAAALSALELWDMECVDENTLRLSLYENDYDAFEALSERCMCEVKRLSAEGGSRDRRTIKRRLALLIFAFITALLLVVSSLFIWEIDVRGNQSISRGELLRALADCGVESGTYWPALSSDMVRSRMMSILPELGWMAVNVNGSRAVVLVVERQEKPDIYEEKAASDIVAKKTGIIKRMSVLNGKAAAAPGQAVTKGELLVSGAMDSIVGGTRFVCSNAKVVAETWYELTSLTPINEELKEDGIISHSRFALVFGKRRVNLYFSSGKTIDECDKIIHEYKLGIGGLFSMPIKLIREELDHYSLKTGSSVRSALMEDKLEARLLEMVNGEVLGQSISEERCGEVYVLTLRAHCLEDIGQSLVITE